MASVTIGRILASIKESGLRPEQAWIAADIYGLNIIELLGVAEKIRNTPLADRIGGLCTYVRVDELCDLVRWKFGGNIDHFTIRPKIIRCGNAVETDILVDSAHMSAIINAQALAAREREVALGQ